MKNVKYALLTLEELNKKLLVQVEVRSLNSVFNIIEIIKLYDKDTGTWNKIQPDQIYIKTIDETYIHVKQILAKNLEVKSFETVAQSNDVEYSYSTELRYDILDAEEDDSAILLYEVM